MFTLVYAHIRANAVSPSRFHCRHSFSSGRGHALFGWQNRPTKIKDLTIQILCSEIKLLISSATSILTPVSIANHISHVTVRHTPTTHTPQLLIWGRCCNMWRCFVKSYDKYLSHSVCEKTAPYTFLCILLTSLYGTLMYITWTEVYHFIFLNYSENKYSPSSVEPIACKKLWYSKNRVDVV